MQVIKSKNREELIKTLKKLGETVVIAKGEILYAFKIGFFPNGTPQDVMEKIKDHPETYDYYKVGSIKITEIKEV